jgi:WD40 repeat protein
VKLWDWARGGEELFALHVDEPCYTSVGISPDGSRIAVGCYYQNEKEECEVKVYDVLSKKLISSFQHDSPPDAEIIFSPSGGYCAFSRQGDVQIRNIETGQELYSLRGGSVAFNNDGTKVAIVRGGGVAILDATSGKPLLQIEYGGVWGNINLAFSPDGRRLVTSHQRGQGGGVKIWDAETGVHLLTLPGGYKSATFSSDGHQLVAIGDDGKAMLWDATPVSNESSK